MDYKNESPFMFRSWYLFLGPACFTLVLLLGYWLSLGVHLSLRPMYLDIHFLWFIFTVQGKERGEFQQFNDLEWSEVQADLVG